MMTPLLTRRQLEILNRRSLHYPLAAAEKDYFLAIALQTIYDSSLKERLVFKGGTALHHCYLPQYRFSEDLDFTSLDREITIDEVIAVLEASQVFTVRKQYRSPHTIKIERLSYEGLLGQAGAIKVEIDCSQSVVRRTLPRRYENAWGVEVRPLVMDIVEICAEKIRATSGRARYRDFYDLFLLLSEGGVDFQEALALVRLKELRETVSQSSMVANWRVAQQQQAGELQAIHCAKVIPNAAIEAMLMGMTFEPISK